MGCGQTTKTINLNGCKLEFYETGRKNRRMTGVQPAILGVGGVELTCSGNLVQEIVWEECTEAKIRFGFKGKYGEYSIIRQNISVGDSSRASICIKILKYNTRFLFENLIECSKILK